AGRVVRLLERVAHDIVGTLKSTGRFLYVVPLHPVYRQDFYVPDQAGAALDDRVVVRFTGWENRHVNPEGEIVEVLGPADEPTVDTISIIRHHGFRTEFPARALREAETASRRLDAAGDRLDLRKRFILTIDPARARDFDDALSLETDADGNRVLGVHIADVSHFVQAGGALDGEARERGTSVYLPDRVIPMLPEQLSNYLCSLRPDADRLAVSAFLTVDGRGRVLKRAFARSVIRSRWRLTYEEAMEILDAGRKSAGGEGALLLHELSRLAQQWRRQRFARHALDLDMPECEIRIGKDGMVSDIRLASNDRSHQLVEECMVAANEAVARELSGRGIPGMYRIHEPPTEKRIQELIETLKNMGYQPGDLRQPRNLARFLKSIADDPVAHYIRVCVLKSMNRAVYSATPVGHYGLAKKFYLHFTSPIRRYPDLLVHRQLTAALVGGQAAVPYDKPSLAAASIHCSDTEQNADTAERSLIEIKLFRYLERQLRERRPETYEAVVVNVMNFGMFVEVLDLRVQGLVHISAISDRFVTFQPRTHALKAGKTVYRVGARVKVMIAAVDFDKRRLDFALA
ncbi:MAG: VacB/RNase II family 3'-5' exoribonuclease, partial [Lentisphaerae bacterium]|nr:VacB/RNase II family 3'-5' exoribonuclease [Lentisphaerota bacterium]